MAITVSAISALVARYGNERINEQVNLNAPYMKMVDELKLEGQVGYVNIKEGGVDSTGWLADGGSLPSGGNVTPAQKTYLPKFIFSRLSIPRGAATLATGKKDGINIVFEQIDTCGADLARQCANGLINSSTLITLDTSSATALGAAGTSLAVTSAGEFRVGQLLERYASTTLEEHMRVTAVSIDEDGTSHVLTVVRDVNPFSGVTNPNTAPANGDIIYTMGGYANAPTSLSDCAGTSAVYSHATNEFTGNTKAAGGALDVQDMRDLTTKAARRRGQMIDFVLANSRTRQLYSDTLLDQRRYVSGKMDATGGVEVDFEGKPVKVDENVNDGTVFGVKKSDLKIHCFKSFADDADGGTKSASSSGHAIVSSSAFEYDHQRWGAYNTRCEKRNGLWSLTGITG